MESGKTVHDLCQEKGLTPQQLAERAGLDEQRVLAIYLGRWTPSPNERDRIATVFGVTRDQIAWGHKTPIQHIYGAAGSTLTRPPSSPSSASPSRPAVP